MGFAADIDDIRRSGQAARDAAAVTASVDPSSAVYAVTIALPGSRTASTVPLVVNAWHDGLTAWSSDIDSHGIALIAAADRYLADDAAAAADIRTIAQPRAPR